MTNTFIYKHHALMDFSQELHKLFYDECHPQPGSSSCYGEYGEGYYIYISNFISRNLNEIADRVGITSNEYTEEQLSAAWDLVDWNFMKGGFVDE